MKDTLLLPLVSSLRREPFPRNCGHASPRPDVSDSNRTSRRLAATLLSCLVAFTAVAGEFQSAHATNLVQLEAPESTEPVAGNVPEEIAAPALDGDASAAVHTGTFYNGVRVQDEIALINARWAGCSCDPGRLEATLDCEQYAIRDGSGARRWQASDLESTLASIDATIPTVVYVHGNRVSVGEDKCEGLSVYRSLARCADDDDPIRFLIFSWPSTQIPGQLRDVRVKIARTRPAGCQLGWLLDQTPPDARLSLIGYSLGAPIVTGGLHVLAGGNLSGIGLAEQPTETRAPVRVVLLGAAMDAQWLAPGRYHGNAMSLVDRMFLVNNRRDLAMRYYHLATTCGRPRALGLTGPTCIGLEGWKIHKRDVSCCCGTTHALQCYLSAGSPPEIWRYVTHEDVGGRPPIN